MKMILIIFLWYVSTTPLILCDAVDYPVMYPNVELLTKIHELSKTIYKQINTNHEALQENYLMDTAVSGDVSAENDDYVSTRSGLTHDCNNKYCTMLMYLVSCKAIGCGVSKYFLPYFYGCDNYYPASEITEAPSVCIPQIIALLTTLQTDPNSLLGGYLGGNFAVNSCGRHCYQNYQYASHDFYYNCRSELNPDKIKLGAGLSLYQEFRNQACAYISTSATSEQNCYQAISSLTTSSTGGPDLFNFECNYYNNAAIDAQVLGQVCGLLSQYGCCAATGITMVHQNQVGVLQSVLQNTTNVNFTVFPPCLMRYLHSSCPTVELMNYCPDGSIARTAAMTGSIFLMNTTGTGAPFTFPDMFNKGSVIKLQGAITYALVNLYAPFMGPPYYMNDQYPFQIQIIDFTYYNGTKYPYSPSDNSIDVFREAVYGNFTYQLVLQDLTKENASLTYTFLDNPYFAGIMGQLYGDPTASVKKGSSPLVYDPVPLYFSSGYSSFATAVRVALTYSLTVAGFVWLSYW